MRMSRYKGRTNKAIIEREFPRHVDMLTPPNGFGNRLNEMYDWLTAHGIKCQHGKAFTYKDHDIVDSNVATVRIDVTATPLPGALPLFATGLGALGLLVWRRKRKQSVL